MCWLAAIPIAATAVGSVAQTWAGYETAKSQNRSLEYNAAANRQNAEYARQEARYARYQGARNAEEARKETGTLIGAQRAKMGASGAVVDVGSFLDVTMSTAEEGEMDAMARLQEGDVEAWKQEARAGEYERQANMALASRTNPNAVLWGGILSGVAATGLSAFAMKDYFGGADAAAVSTTRPLSSGNRIARAADSAAGVKWS